MIIVKRSPSIQGPSHHIPTTHQCEECTIVPGLGTYVTKSIDKKSPEIGKFPCSAVFLSSPSVRLRLCRSHVRTVSGTPNNDPPSGGSFFDVPDQGGFASYLCLPFKAIPYRVRKGLHVRFFLCHWFVNPFTTDSLYGIIYNYPSSCTVYGWTNENDGVHKWTKNG